MGLGFSHSTAHWSYIGFMHFRERLALHIGINLHEMAGFSDDGKSWSKIKSPLKYLLNHSDCDGQISAKRCGKIWPELKNILLQWDPAHYDVEMGLLLCDGMEQAAKELKPFKFY